MDTKKEPQDQTKLSQNTLTDILETLEKMNEEEKTKLLSMFCKSNPLTPQSFENVNKSDLAKIKKLSSHHR